MTIGPSMDRSSAATYAASLRNSRSGLAAPIARKPWPRSARIERSQPLVSAHAPWTKTTVGLVVSMLAPLVRGRTARPSHASLPRCNAQTWYFAIPRAAQFHAGDGSLARPALHDYGAVP